MSTPFDWLHTSLKQAGLETLSRQTALSPDTIARSAAAFAPVFTLALQRMASDPTSLRCLLDPTVLSALGRYGRDPASAFSMSGLKDGQALLPLLFGSDSSAKMMRDWVARMCGVEPDPVAQLQSGFAAMIAANLAQTLDMPERDAGDLDKLASRLLEFGQLKLPDHLPNYNPFAEAMTSFLDGFLGPKPPQTDDDAQKGQDPLSEMMKAGGALQESYFQELNAMFERATGS